MIHRKKSQFEWIDWYCFDKQCFDLPKMEERGSKEIQCLFDGKLV